MIIKEGTNTDFEKMWTHYIEGAKLNLHSLIQVRDISSKYLKGDLLDVGNGGICVFDLAKVRSVTILDLIADLIRDPHIVIGNKLKPVKSKKIKALKANVLNIPLPNKSFNVVSMYTVIHHLSKETVIKSKKAIELSLKEISRVLKDDGTFLLLECCPPPILQYIEEFIYKYLYKMFRIMNKYLPFFLTENQIVSLLLKNNYKIVKIYKITSGNKVYFPVMPILSPPGWLGDTILHLRLFVCEKS